MNGTEVNNLMKSYKDQNISDFHQVWTCDYFFFPLTFASSYLIYSFGALADLKSESKEWIFPIVYCASVNFALITLPALF